MELRVELGVLVLDPAKVRRNCAPTNVRMRMRVGLRMRCTCAARWRWRRRRLYACSGVPEHDGTRSITNFAATSALGDPTSFALQSAAERSAWRDGAVRDSVTMTTQPSYENEVTEGVVPT